MNDIWKRKSAGPTISQRVFPSLALSDQRGVRTPPSLPRSSSLARAYLVRIPVSPKLRICHRAFHVSNGPPDPDPDPTILFFFFFFDVDSIRCQSTNLLYGIPYGLGPTINPQILALRESRTINLIYYMLSDY